MSSNNFFEPYIKEPERFNYERVFWMTTVAMSIFLMTIIFLTNTLRLSAVDNQIVELEAKITSSEMQNKLQEVKQIETTMLKMETSAKKLRFLNISMAKNRSFTHDIFTELNIMVPQNLFLLSINYDNRLLEMSGYSESVENVALFAHQLSSLPIFDMVRVSDIVSQNDNFLFDMSTITPYTFIIPTNKSKNKEVPAAKDEEVEDAKSKGE